MDKALVYRVSFDGLDKQIDAIGKVDRELSNLTATVKDQRKSLEILEKKNQKNTQVYADLTNELGKNIVQQRNLTKQKGDLIRETQNEAKVNQENEGSIVSLRAQLSNLTKEYNNLTKAERESARGQDVQKQAKALSDKLKSLEGAVGNNTRNVGNYSDALKGLSGQFNIAGVNVGGLIDKFQNFRNTAQSIVDTLGNTENSLKGNAAATATFNTASSNSTGILGRVVGALGKFRIALISTGIGAIVVVLGSLVAAFASTQKGIDVITRALRPLQVAFERVVGFIQDVALDAFESPKEALSDLGDFIIGQFTNRFKALNKIFEQAVQSIINLGKAFAAAAALDFEAAGDAIDAAGENVKNIGSNLADFGTGVEGTVDKLKTFTAETIKTANELSDLAVKIEQVENRNKTLIASLNAQIEAEKALAADTSKTAAEREAAGKKAIELIEQRKAAELELIELQIQELTLKQKQNDTSRQEEGLLQDLIAKRDEAKRAAEAAGKEVTSQINAAIKAQEDAIKAQVQANKAALDQINALRQANNLASIEDTEERTRKELELQNQANLASVELLKVSEQLKQQIRDAFNEQYKIAIDQLNADIAAKEADAQFQLNQVRLDGEKQFITDKIALGQFELDQLTQKQQRELEVFDGTETEKNILLQKQLNARNALIQKNDALLLKTQFDNEQARIEAELISTANQAERDRLAFELLISQQQEEIALFQGSEEQKTLIIAQQSEKRNQILQAQQQAQIQSNLAIAQSYTNLFGSLAGLFRENAAIQKAATLFQIGVDTAKAISAGIAGATTAATATGPGAFVATPIFIASTIATVLGAIAQATAALKGAPEFKYGGIFEKFAQGGQLAKQGGWIKGNSHANGGVKFSVGGRVMEAEGGEIIVNKGIQKRPDFVKAISEMNYMTGGKRFETGGIVAPKFSAAGVSLASQQQVGQNITLEVPAMQVLNNVVDTTDQQSSIIQIQNQVTL